MHYKKKLNIIKFEKYEFYCIIYGRVPPKPVFVSDDENLIKTLLFNELKFAQCGNYVINQ